MATPLSDALAAGNREAFAALYDRLGTRLFATARTMLDSTAEAEDVVHDLFLDLARFRHRLASVSDLDGYVFTMLRHAVGRRIRRRVLDRRAVDRLGTERRGAGFSSLPEEPADESLAAAVAALPPPQREVIALKIDGGLTFAEIAAVVGVSASTAASRYRYALDKLRAALASAESRR